MGHMISSRIHQSMGLKCATGGGLQTRGSTFETKRSRREAETSKCSHKSFMAS